MCAERKNQILRALEDKMPSGFKHSNNQQLEEALNSVVEGMSEIVFEKTHAECRTIKDLKEMIWQITYESKDVNKNQLNLLDDEMDKLEKYLKVVKTGNTGEKRAYKELVQLSEDGLTSIIQNITLEKDSDERAEYDDVIISPNGVFIVEVKNIKSPATIDKHGNLRWGEYGFINYSRDSRRRKYVLKAALKEYLESKGVYETDFSVEEILLWTNDRSTLDNQKSQSIISKRVDEVCDYIEDYPCRRKLRVDEISMITEILKQISVKNEYPIKDVNIKNIYEKFSYVIAAYENERILNAENYMDSEAQEQKPDQDVIRVVEEESMVKKCIIGLVAAAGWAATAYLGGKALAKYFKR